LTENTVPFNWKQAAKLGGIAFLCAFVAGVSMLAFAPLTVNAEKVGQGVGRLAGFSFLGGMCVSYMEQTGQKLFPRLVKIGFLLMLLGLVVFAATYEPPALSGL
jgi:uncharacterized membrane protein